MARPDPHRRGMLTGMGLTLLVGGTGQEPDQTRLPTAPLDLDRRFLTRLGAAVTLNGHHRRVFLIDTGAAATSIADTVAADLALPSREPVMVHGTTGAEVMPSVGLGRLLVQGQVFHDLRCPVFRRAELGADGLLGVDVLARYHLSFDMERRQASLAPRRPMRTSVGPERGRADQLIVVPAFVNGHEAMAFIDSGSQQTVGNLALRSALGAIGETGALSTRAAQIHGVAGRAASSEASAIASLEIGAGRLNDVPLLFADLYCFDALGIERFQPALLIGADVLTRFRWVTMDFAGNRLWLEGPRRVPAA